METTMILKTTKDPASVRLQANMVFTSPVGVQRAIDQLRVAQKWLATTKLEEKVNEQGRS